MGENCFCFMMIINELIVVPSDKTDSVGAHCDVSTLLGDSDGSRGPELGILHAAHPAPFLLQGRARMDHENGW